MMSDHQPDEVREPATVYDVDSSAQAVARPSLIERMRPAKFDLLDLGYPPEAPHDLAISEALRELRAEP